MIDSALLNANILIVENQEADIDVLKGFFGMLGYNHIETTTDARQVLPLYESFSPDIILLDLMMAPVNAFKILERLKVIVSSDDYLPILILGSDISPEIKEHALREGAKDFLSKPFDLVEVGQRVRNLLFSKYLHQQIQCQNLTLEQKVKDRTRELEKINKVLTKAKEKAEASDRLKTAFIQNISHEIRTPLNGILGFSDLLVDPTISAEDKNQFVNLIQSSSNRLLDTINDYVNIALIVSGNVKVKKEKVDIDEILKDSEDHFRKKAEEKGLQFDLSIPERDNPLIVETDQEMFKRVLYHLMDNALKFTYQGQITVGYEQKPDIIEFYIKDTGIGVEDSAKEKIFEIFMQEDVSLTREHEGSGLGLSIVKGLLALLRGTIRMESIKGKGSVFFFTLPLKS